MRQERKIIDLFCGAGGLSLGAHLAGFSTALAVDMDSNLTSAFQENFPGSKLLLADISQLSGKSLLDRAGLKSNEVAGIVGGPPCQGFSLMGRRNVADPRNAAVGHFFRLINEIKPKFFVMENVPGIMLGDSKRAFESVIAGIEGYQILGPIRLNACDFGAATDRERVVVIGTQENAIKAKEIQIQKVTRKASVRGAISDIPEPTAGGWGSYSNFSRLSSYAVRARATHPNIGAAFFKKAIKEGRVSGLQPTFHTDEVRSRFSSVAPGKNDNVSRCPRLKCEFSAVNRPI
jgi:DNA (cytosine-5)-methyltransferase 1